MSSIQELPTASELVELANAAATACGVDLTEWQGDHVVTSPVNGAALHSLPWVDHRAVDATVDRAHNAFLSWRSVPAPVRGGLVQQFGRLLLEHKEDLAVLISLEV